MTAENALPLRGRTVLVTTPYTVAGVAARVRKCGAIALSDPLQSYHPGDADALTNAMALASAGGYAWLVLTSARAVPALAEHAAPGGLGALTVRVAAVGARTAAAARHAGLAVTYVPERGSAEGLLATWPADPADAGGRVLLPLSSLAPDTLEQGLRERGLVPHRVEAYRVCPREPLAQTVAALRAGLVDAAVVTSGSTARRLADLADGPDGGLPLPPRVVAIGGSTARIAREAGLPVVAVAPSPHPVAVVDTLIAALGGSARGSRSTKECHDD